MAQGGDAVGLPIPAVFALVDPGALLRAGGLLAGARQLPFVRLAADSRLRAAARQQRCACLLACLLFCCRFEAASGDPFLIRRLYTGHL